jgi:hypothetical protein
MLQPDPSAGYAYELMPDCGSVELGVTVTPPAAPPRNQTFEPSKLEFVNPEKASEGADGADVSTIAVFDEA